ncbi:MAG: arginine--tRNA ligase [Bacteroidetes bacterium]|nr:arginine--tRNA ligase [Bacteroidota bacterium]
MIHPNYYYNKNMIQNELKKYISQAFLDLYKAEISTDSIAIEKTSDDYEGDYTFVVFPYLKTTRKSPEQTAQQIGEYLIQQGAPIQSFEVLKGFLNLVVKAELWIQFLQNEAQLPEFGSNHSGNQQKVLVEYSSPNTNKPLHLGHIRNNLLGYSIIQILKANGFEVKSCNLINDRGIHICKSMLAWLEQGNGETPESSGIKGDHLVGKYYVVFEKQNKLEKEQLIASGMSEEEAGKSTPSMKRAQDLLRKWEAGDEETIQIWKTMNGWVYDGFGETYSKLGVNFDQFYYESNTYLLGKELVQEGLDKGVFFKKADGSVWVDLTDDGLDQKLLLRGDGTSVYITQDLGTAELKFGDFAYNRSVYVVGNEQDYHFKVLKLILKKLNKPYAEGIYHLSYGMVELPDGKMKSREGKVVDADDLIQEMVRTAGETTEALGKTEGLTEEAKADLFHLIGMGALKYFLLKVDPRKKMLFNPAESIDFQGNTGPFIQYTHARIRSVLRNGAGLETSFEASSIAVSKAEKNLIKNLYQYPLVVAEAAREMSPGVVCNYLFDLAKSYNQFYHDHSILKEEDPAQRAFRLVLCDSVGRVIRHGGSLLGIGMPEKM